MRASKVAMWVSAIALIGSGCGDGNEAPQPAPATVTVTQQESANAGEVSDSASSAATEQTTLSEAERNVIRSRRLNKRHPNDGRNTFILDSKDRVYGLVAAKVAPCQPEPRFNSGCIILALVNITSAIDNLLVNPADFYVLDKSNRRYNLTDGEAPAFPIDERLGMSGLNEGEVIDGRLIFDAPAHGRLVYAPPYSDEKVVWIY